MVAVQEKEFIRTFILELILVQKESVFDLRDCESVLLPNSYMEILDEILTDDIKKARYASLIPVQNIQEWKFNITKELHDFFNSSGVSISYQNSDVKISLNSAAITKILFNEKVNLNTKSKMSLLAEDFLMVKNKVKPKQKKLV